jgi:hypothetical protein
LFSLAETDGSFSFHWQRQIEMFLFPDGDRSKYSRYLSQEPNRGVCTLLVTRQPYLSCNMIQFENCTFSDTPSIVMYFLMLCVTAVQASQNIQHLSVKATRTRCLYTPICVDTCRRLLCYVFEPFLRA